MAKGFGHDFSTNYNTRSAVKQSGEHRYDLQGVPVGSSWEGYTYRKSNRINSFPIGGSFAEEHLISISHEPTGLLNLGSRPEAWSGFQAFQSALTLLGGSSKLDSENKYTYQLLGFLFTRLESLLINK